MKNKIIIGLCLFVLVALASFAVADVFLPYYNTPSVPDAFDLASGGDFSVSKVSGAATYSVPIEVPPGTNGLQPQLSLSYNSQATKGHPGLVGTAWSMTEYHIYRHVNYDANSRSNDYFVLMFGGESHDLIYNSTDDVYKTEIETYYRIQLLTGGDNQLNEYWLLTTPDGTQYRFGYYNESEMIASYDSNTAHKWHLDLITDTVGNTIEYNYEEDPFTNDVRATYPMSIVYNNDKSREIIFSYETSNRPDSWMVYDEGSNTRFGRRLSHISTFANDSLVKRYQLNYTTSGVLTRRMINNITIYGNDNVSSLPPTQFRYNPETKGWTGSGAASPPVYFLNSGDDDMVRLGDFNGDGITDIIKSEDGSSNNRVWFGTGTSWSQQSYSSPEYFGNRQSTYSDYGVRLGDVNGDGKTDVMRARSSNFRTSFSTGNGFSDQSFYPPEYFASSGVNDNGVRVVDLNGDGKADIVRYYEGCSSNQNKVYLSTGSGWAEKTYYDIPSGNYIAERDACFSGIEDAGFRFVDLNGDGLTDFVRAKEYQSDSAYLNTGKSWTPIYSFALPDIVDHDGLDNGYRFLDLNGDGLTDYLKGIDNNRDQGLQAYINIGLSFTQDNSWSPPYYFVTASHESLGIRIGDITGDGLPDLISGTSNDLSARANRNAKAWLLQSVQTPLGATINFTYAPSTSFDNTGNDTKHDLSFNMWVVDTITTHNGLEEDYELIQTKNYTYANGFYDYEEKDFRGFANVSEEDSQGRIIKSYYAQTDALKFKPLIEEVYENESLYQRVLYTWNVEETDNYVVELDSQETQLFDGTSTNVTTKVSYDYDDYGNMNLTLNHGDIAITGDEYSVEYDFSYNTSDWLVNYLHTVTTLNSSSDRIKEEYYSYDGQSHQSIPKDGLRTNIEQWLNTGTNPVTEFEYDSYGNVIVLTDPRGYQTNYTFDSSHTFPTTVKNSQGHTITTYYDPGIGQPTLSIDANGEQTRQYYDVFGRKTSFTNSLHSNTQTPFTNYTYQMDGGAPTSIVMMQKNDIHCNGDYRLSDDPTSNCIENISEYHSMNTYQYFDGFGNLIRQKEEWGDEFSSFDMYYDERGNVLAISQPYWSQDNEFETLQPKLLYDLDFDSDISTGVTTTELNGSGIIYGLDLFTENLLDGYQGSATKNVELIATEEFYLSYTSFRCSTPFYDDVVLKIDGVISEEIYTECPYQGKIQGVHLQGLTKVYPGDLIKFEFPNWIYKVDSFSSSYTTGNSALRELRVLITNENKSLMQTNNLSILKSNRLTLDYSIIGGNVTTEYSVDGTSWNTIPKLVEIEIPTTTNVFFRMNLSGTDPLLSDINYTVDYVDDISGSSYYLETSSLETQYDVLDRPKQITNPDGTRKVYTYDGFDVNMVDEVGMQRLETKDAYGRIESINNSDGTYSDYTLYDHDWFGNVIYVQDNLGNEFSYVFDSLQRKTADTDPNTGTTEYLYDLSNNLIRQEKENGKILTQHYDSLNRITQKNSSTEQLNYTYDLQYIGTLSSVDSDNYQKVYRYDELYRIIEENLTIDGQTFTTQNLYGPDERPLQVTRPDEATNTLKYDDRNLLVEYSPVMLSSVYNVNKLPLRKEYSNSENLSFYYQKNNSRLQRISSKNLDKTYTFDNRSSIIQIEDSIANKTSLMDYDYLDRLVYASRTDDYNISYTYDSIGNILYINSTDKNISFSYSALAHAPSTIIVTGELVIHESPTLESIQIKNTSGSIVTELGYDGSISLAGTCTISSSGCSITGDAVYFNNESGQTVAYIDFDGNLCATSGFCDTVSSCTASEESFIVENDTGDTVSYISFGGELCLTGDLNQNVNWN